MSVRREEVRGVVVTGGARGIGRAVAQRLGRDGAGVMIVDRDGEALERAEAELSAEGLRIVSQEGDVTIRSDIRRAIEACVAAFGGLDAMVSNAGMAIVAPLMDIDEEGWARVVDVNLSGAFICTQEAARVMLADRGGSIIITSSTNGFFPEQGHGAYNAAKGGVINWVRSAALDLARYRIRVNGIAPGMTATQGSSFLTDDPVLGPAYVKTIPMGRFAQPEDVADTYAFFVSPDSRWVTGQTLTVDGGHSLGVMLPDMDIDSPWQPVSHK